MVNKNEKTTIEQYISNGIARIIDNFILQKIFMIIEEHRDNIENDEILTLKLNGCPFSLRQHILVVDESDEKIDRYCELCNEIANTVVLVYQFKDKNITKRVLCLSCEMDDMLSKEMFD